MGSVVVTIGTAVGFFPEDALDSAFFVGTAGFIVDVVLDDELASRSPFSTA